MDSFDDDKKKYNLAIYQIQMIADSLRLITFYHRNKSYREWYSALQSLKNLVCYDVKKELTDELDRMERLINFCFNKIDAESKPDGNKFVIAHLTKVVSSYIDEYNMFLMKVINFKGYLNPDKGKRNEDLYGFMEENDGA